MDYKQIYSTQLYPPTLTSPSLDLTISQSPPSSTTPPSSSAFTISFAFEIDGAQVVKGPALRDSVWTEHLKMGFEEFKDVLGLDHVGDFMLPDRLDDSSLVVLPLILLPPYPTSPPPSLLVLFSLHTDPNFISFNPLSLLDPNSPTPQPLHFLLKSLLSSAINRLVHFLTKQYPEYFSGDWKKCLEGNEEERKGLGESLNKVLLGGGGFQGENGRKRDELILKLHQALHPSHSSSSSSSETGMNLDATSLLTQAQRHFSGNLQSALLSLSQSVIKPSSMSLEGLMKNSRKGKGKENKKDQDTLEDFSDQVEDDQAPRADEEHNDDEIELDFDVFDEEELGRADSGEGGTIPFNYEDILGL